MISFDDLLFSPPDMSAQDMLNWEAKEARSKLCSRCNTHIPCARYAAEKLNVCKKCKAADRATNREAAKQKRRQDLLSTKLAALAPMIEQHGLWAARSPHYLQRQIAAKRKALLRVLKSRLYAISGRKTVHGRWLAELGRKAMQEKLNSNPPKTCTVCGVVKRMSDFPFIKYKGQHGGKICSACKLENYTQYLERMAEARAKKEGAKAVRAPKMSDAERLRRNKESKRMSKIRARQDPMRRINRNFSECVRKQFRQMRAGKSCGGWKKLVGYTILDLKRHLEDRFTAGMTWENYGLWHIDHIRPKSSFTFTGADDPQFLECWGLHNLQPLWGPENCRKGKRYSTSTP